MTLGKERARVNFNPSKENYVDQIKEAADKLIDLINDSESNSSWSNPTLGEWKRLKSLAMTAAEESAMWAVKAATI